MTPNKPSHPTTPTAYLGGPSLRPQPLEQAARTVVSVPGPPVPKPAPPVKRTHLTEPTLSVRLPNRVTLSAELVKQVDDSKRLPGETIKNQRERFGLGSPVELVPPAQRGGTWHLDTRPTAGRRLPRTAGSRAEFVTSHTLSRTHFQQVRPTLQITKRDAQGRISGSTNQNDVSFRSRLAFRLGPEVPGAPGYFQLLPA